MMRPFTELQTGVLSHDITMVGDVTCRVVHSAASFFRQKSQTDGVCGTRDEVMITVRCVHCPADLLSVISLSEN